MKGWWGLAASALSLLIIVLAYLAMVAGLPTVERLSRDEAAPGIEVPVIGTVGDFPDPAHRHVVNVFADGRIVVEGKEVTFAVLGDELRQRASRSSGAELPGSPGRRLSAESVLLRVDAGVGWGASCALMSACADANVNQVYFAVRHEGDGAEGALAVFVPTDAGSEEFGDPSIDQRTVVVKARPGRGTPDAVRAFLAALPESRTSKLIVAFDADPSLATGSALSMFDAVLRSGAASAEIIYGPHPWFDDAHVRAGSLAGASSLSREITITDESWTDATNAARHEHHGRATLEPVAPPPPMPPVERVRGAPAGVTMPRSLVLCD